MPSYLSEALFVFAAGAIRWLAWKLFRRDRRRRSRKSAKIS